MTEEPFHKRTPEELTGELADRLAGMDEAGFDGAVIDAYLAALEAEDPAPAFDGGEALTAFHERHKALFEQSCQEGEAPRLEVLPAGEPKRRRPRVRRLAGRVAAVAAVAAVTTVAVCQGMGIDLLGFLGRWGKGEFWFPSAAVDQLDGPGYAAQAELKTGPFDSLTAALKANGHVTPMAPTWTPGKAEGFGALKLKVEVTKEKQSTLFTADYRDGQGKGYTVEVTRDDMYNMPHGVNTINLKGLTEYVCDGVTYYIGAATTGEDETWILWTRGELDGRIRGDLDTDAAMKLARSITRDEAGNVLARTDPKRETHFGGDLQNNLRVTGLDENLAPVWLPEGFELKELHTNYDMPEIYALNATYGDGESGREFAIHLEWWEEPSTPPEPVFERTGTTSEAYEHNGVTYTIMDDGADTIAVWRKGRVSGYISGGLTRDETLRMIDSIPLWSETKPEREERPMPPQPVRDEREYESLSEALADHGLDAGLAPGWMPEGYELWSAQSTSFSDPESGEQISDLSVNAAYIKGEDLFQVNLTVYRDEADAQNSFTYMKDDNPVVEYEHNGIVYYIMTNYEYRNIAWKDGLLEGSIGGPITLEEAKRVVDSIGYAAGG